MSSLSGDNVVSPADAYFGITYWAQWFNDRVPKYTVYKYIGKNTRNFHFFVERGSSNLLVRTYHEMCTDITFRPFLYNFKKIDLAMLKKNS